MKQSKISVGIACLIMSSSFAALAGGPAPVAQNNKMFTVYTNLNGDASMLAGDINKTTSGDKKNGIRLSGGVNIGLGAKLSEKANAFVQLSADNYYDQSDAGFDLAAMQKANPKGTSVDLDKAYVNYNFGKFTVQAGQMGMIDMSTFVASNLNAWTPITAGYNTNDVTQLFAADAMQRQLGVNRSDSYNGTAAAIGAHFGKIYATAMYSVNRDNAKSERKDSGFFGKQSRNNIDAQIAYKTDKFVVSGNVISALDNPTGTNDERTLGLDLQGAFRMGKMVLTALVGNIDDKANLLSQNPAGGVYKATYFSAGASYNLDLFGLNHTWQVNWMMDNNGKDTGKKGDLDPSNTIQVNDIIPVFNKHMNVIPYFVTTLNKDGVKTGTKKDDTQFGVAFQGLWSVNV